MANRSRRAPAPGGAADPALPYRAGVGGPPWILGHRGAPREAPENTLASLRRALELGLDGVEYDCQALASGEAVLLHDETLDRTTDHVGPVEEVTLPELAGIDAGAWFHKRFRGEPLPLLQEALELPVAAGAPAPLHMIEVKDPALVSEVARAVRGFPGLGVRLASFDRGACVEAGEHGLPAMLLAEVASEDDRRFVRDARLAAYSVGPGGWDAEAWAGAWDCERWAWSLDDPDECLWAARAPLFGWNTNEPHRALAARALARLAPACARWPVRAPALEVEPDPRAAGRHGPWSGAWSFVVRVANPFAFPVRAIADVLVRGGAFEVDGLPAALALGPGEEGALEVALAGGSWSPGEDPRLLVRFAWRVGPRRAGTAAREVVLDTTLERRRSVMLGGGDARRLAMLVERPGDRGGTMVIRRRGRDLLAKVEDPGGLTDVRALVRLGGAVRRGAVGLRVPLPADFDGRAGGVAFSAGFQGRDAAGRVVVRRWAGGLPGGIAHGAPGRLHGTAG
jgi:glycerophosphoryl diester phosphodiesterase